MALSGWESGHHPIIPTPLLKPFLVILSFFPLALLHQGINEEWDSEIPAKGGKFRGMILRSHLITMLKFQCWGKLLGETTTQPQLTYVIFCDSSLVLRMVFFFLKNPMHGNLWGNERRLHRRLYQQLISLICPFPQ